MCALGLREQGERTAADVVHELAIGPLAAGPQAQAALVEGPRPGHVLDRQHRGDGRIGQHGKPPSRKPASVLGSRPRSWREAWRADQRARPDAHTRPFPDTAQAASAWPAWRLQASLVRLTEAAMDDDLQTISREELVAEVVKLRQAIRARRDA